MALVKSVIAMHYKFSSFSPLFLADSEQNEANSGQLRGRSQPPSTPSPPLASNQRASPKPTKRAPFCQPPITYGPGKCKHVPTKTVPHQQVQRFDMFTQVDVLWPIIFMLLELIHFHICLLHCQAAVVRLSSIKSPPPPVSSASSPH